MNLLGSLTEAFSNLNAELGMFFLFKFCASTESKALWSAGLIFKAWNHVKRFIFCLVSMLN